jgi:CBS domain-containing protein
MLGMLDAKPKVGYFIGNTSGHPQKQKTIHYKVKDVQGVPVVIKQTATVHDAVVSLFLEDVGSLMVISDEGHLTGIVSRKDLLKVTMGNPHAATMPISLVMTREPNIISVAPEDSVVYAAEKLMKHEIDSLPVVINNEQNKLEVVGRVTKTTMTRMLLELIKQD